MPDSTRNCKNYETDGGDTWEIGGTLDLQTGSKFTKDGTQIAAITKPVGGTTIDAEGRVAIGLIVDALKSIGITL